MTPRDRFTAALLMLVVLAGANLLGARPALAADGLPTELLPVVSGPGGPIILRQGPMPLMETGAGAGFPWRPALAASDVRSAAIVPGEPIIVRPGPAQQIFQETPAAWAPWQAALAKTASFRALSAVDLAATVALFGWSAASGITVAGVASLSALYFLNDLAWASFAPPAEDTPIESALWRFVTYRVVAEAFAALTGIGQGGDFVLMQAVWIGDLLLEGAVYFFHEFAWLAWGPPIDRPS